MPSGITKAPVKKIRWDAYVKEVAKPPIEIELADGKKIVIHEPSGGAMIDAQDMNAANASIRDQLVMLCGDAADDVVELLRGSPGSAVLHFIEDMMEHFGYGSLGEGMASQT